MSSNEVVCLADVFLIDHLPVSRGKSLPLDIVESITV